jgi:antitoxin (DNA-binding transcriptional repressor) of toxin-antitoxin stability system
MDAISIFDAESSLGSLLDALEAGQDVLVLRDGKPVARLVPPTREDTTALTVGGLRALRDRITARGETFSPDEIEIFRGEDRR